MYIVTPLPMGSSASPDDAVAANAAVAVIASQTLVFLMMRFSLA
jgi:hypothetical protein